MHGQIVLFKKWGSGNMRYAECSTWSQNNVGRGKGGININMRGKVGMIRVITG